MKKITWHIETRKLVDLKRWEQNPRRITKDGMKHLSASIGKFGLAEPLVCQPDGGLIGGHARLEALIAAGETSALCMVPNRQLTPAERDECGIRLNKNIAGEFDFDALANNFDVKDLTEWGFTLEDLDLEPDDPADADAQIDRAAELNEKWKVKTGDLWSIGEHRLFCGESEKNIGLIVGKYKLDAVITDPPYGINIVRGLSAAIGGAKIFGRVRQPGGRTPKMLGKVGGPGVVKPRLYRPIANDDRPFNPVWLLSLAPVCILFGANHYASRLPDSPAWLVWDKGVSDQSTFSACELVWLNVGNHIKRYEWRWSRMVRAGDREIEMKDRIHPTQKPVGLIENIIKDFTKEKAVIIDPYLGSGTMLLAAARTSRICVGGELDDAYCAVILQRMSDAFPGIKIEKLK